MVEVRQARYFLAVVDTLHFGRAAEQLHMSQPPLSQAILQLERQLGVRLLDRVGRKVTLTETGHAFAAEPLCVRLR
jgi:DNA-binding transcriptional LysR family regulator